MNTPTLRRITILWLTAALTGSHPAAQGTDPVIGTWVLNVAKSTFSPGPAPQSETRTCVMEELKTRMTAKDVAEPRTYMTVRQEITATSHVVDGDGKAVTRDWTIVPDGRDHPMSVDPGADTLSLKRIDALTMAFTQKRSGSVVITGTQAISRDGKVMTVTTNGINANGQTIHDVAVFEKQ